MTLQGSEGYKEGGSGVAGEYQDIKDSRECFFTTKNLKVANIPLMPEVKPPKSFEISPKKIIGLVISPDQLNSIRLERLKTHGLSGQANYASKERIAYEQKYAEEIMSKIGCRVVDVTDKAIEETANIILQILKEANEE